MKVEVYYLITSAAGSEHRFETKEDAKEAWTKVVNAFDAWCREHESTDCPNCGWIPSLKHDHILTEQDYQLTGDFHYQFECLENGQDVVKHLHHRLTTHVEAA